MAGNRKGRLRGEEELARRIVQNALGRSVRQNDDGSAPSMYDLRIGPSNAPEVAIEIVGAVDPKYTATWNTLVAKGPWRLPVAGAWTVVVSPGASIKKLRQDLASLLGELESRGITNAHVDHHFKRDDEELFRKLSSLRIEQAYSYESPDTGKVSFSMPGFSGAVDHAGTKIPEWIGAFLRESAQADVLSKLGHSGAPARHAFVIATLARVPWGVASYLLGDRVQVPDEAPDLPEPVTAVWVIGGLGDKGLFWDGTLWRHVSTRGDAIEGPPPLDPDL